jgi:hypothetical protein
VRRPLAACLAAVMFWALLRPAAVHMHAYSGHDHADHDHGLATHDHHPRPTPSGADESDLSSCNPAAHAVFFKSATTMASAVFAAPFEAVDLYVLAVESGGCAVMSLEAREHGPPRFTLPARAPPSSTAA